MSLPSDPLIGSDFVGYRIEALVGRGGMGVVYRAYDPRLKRHVALKVISPALAGDDAFRDRFLTETELAVSLEHPNVVPIYDAGDVDGQLYIAMRLVDGTDLKQLLAHSGALDSARALAVVSQVAEALDSAHSRSLVHRDVKPSNVLLDENEHAYLADFGMTKRMSDASGTGGRSLGTIDYAAPEQIRGEEVDGRADVYSLGCLLYECLTGRPPFDRLSEVETLFAHLEEEPPAPVGLEAVMATALAKSPEDRFQTCGELLGAAREALGVRTRRGLGRPVAIALVAALLAGGLAAFFVSREGGGKLGALSGDVAVARIDPETNTVVERVPIGRTADAVAVGGRYVWAVNRADGAVTRLDHATGRVATIAVHGTPADVVATGNRALVAEGPDNKSVLEIEAESRTVTFALKFAGGISPLVANGPSGLWLADPDAGAVFGAGDLRGGQGIGVPIPRNGPSFLSTYETFGGLAVGNGEVWVSGDAFAQKVWRVDLASRRVLAIPVPFIPGAIAVGGKGVWVISLVGDTVSRIDSSSGRIARTTRVGRGAADVVVGDGGVWVANAIAGTVSRLDPQTGDLVATIGVGGAPRRLAIGAGGVWVVPARL